jgi:integrase
LISFLKCKSKGYIPKKSQVLTGDQVLTFIKGAPDDIYLLHKVVLVMGVFGGLRRDEMVKMFTGDISDKGNVLVVKVPETKTATPKSFTIVEEEEIGALKLIRKYMALRPNQSKERRFFLTYRNGRCSTQPVGKNTIGGVPNIIAKYLKLENPQQYTGHCLRRTSSTLLIEAGASFETLKMHGKWKSNTVAQSYVEESISSKNRVSNMIASAVSCSSEAEPLTNIYQIDKTSTFASIKLTPTLEQSESTSSNPNKNKISENLSRNPVSFSGKFENCNFYFDK